MTCVILTFMMHLGGKPPIFYYFCQFLENPPMFKEDLPKKGPLSREFWLKNRPILAANTCTLNMLCKPSSPGVSELIVGYFHIIFTSCNLPSLKS